MSRGPHLAGAHQNPSSTRTEGVFVADGLRYSLQSSIDAAHAAGGGTVLLTKDTTTSEQIRLKDGVLLVCSGAPHYDNPATYSAAAIRPAPGFQAKSVILADPAVVSSSLAFTTGVGIENCVIDMKNVATAGKIAIELRGVSNSGPFRNLTVVNQDTGQYLFIGRSSNPKALVSEGITFRDFYALSNSTDPANTDPGVIIEEANEVVFSGARTKIMRRTAGSPAPDSIGVLIRSNGPYGANHITFDGISVVGYSTHISVRRLSGSVAPRWVRVLGCTFEVFNRGVELAGDARTSVQYAFVGNGNRFITPVGSSPANTYIDYGADSTLMLDEYATSGAKAVILTAHSRRNLVFTQPSLVSNSGLGNLIFGRSGELGSNSGRLRAATGVQFDVGVASDGSGIKHARLAIASCGTTGCSVTWVFTTPFADTNFTVSCSVEEASAQSETAGLRFAKIRSKTPNEVITDFDNLSSSALNGTAHCIAVHD